MAKRIESQREEAYRNYVSDSLTLFFSMMSRGEVELPRYSDMIRPSKAQPQETSEEIIGRFDKLRRK